VDHDGLARRAAHYTALDAEGRNARFHAVMPQDRANDWAAAALPDLMFFAGRRCADVPEGLAEIHRLARDPGHGELALSVVPGARRRGLGRQLLAAAVEAGRAAGLQRLELNYTAANRPMGWLMQGQGAEIRSDGPDRVALIDLLPNTVRQDTDLNLKDRQRLDQQDGPLIAPHPVKAACTPSPAEPGPSSPTPP
jgi:GNAT superfamily N-acetyltransferase